MRELIDLSTLCLDHYKGKQYHCLTCAQDVCNDCTTVGHHTSHQHQLREEIVEEQRESLSLLVASTESALQAANAQRQLLKEAAVNNITAKNTINQAFEQLHAALQARRQVLLQEVEESSRLQVMTKYNI